MFSIQEQKKKKNKSKFFMQKKNYYYLDILALCVRVCVEFWFGSIADEWNREFK